MKTALYVLVAFALTAVAGFVVLSSWYPANSFELGLVGAYFLLGGLGCLWMIFTILRHEKKIWPLILLALCLPFSFIWYYFERVRPRMRTATKAAT